MLFFSPESFLSPVILSISFFTLFVFLIKSLNSFESLKYSFFNKNFLMILVLLISLLLALSLFVADDIIPVDKFNNLESKLLNSHYVINDIQLYKYSVVNYALSEIISCLLGIIGFIITGFIITNKLSSIKSAAIQILILIFSPLIYLGIIVQGEYLFTISLINLVFISLDKKEGSNDTFLFLIGGAFLSGIVLFFNLAAIIPVILFSFFFYRDSILKAFSFTFLAIIILTILYFLFDISSINGNPGNIIWVMLIFSIIALYFGWSVSNIYEVFFAAGLLSLLLLTSLVIIDLSNYSANSIFPGFFSLNIVLYNIPVLFLTLSVHEYKIDKFLGKVLTDN